MKNIKLLMFVLVGFVSSSIFAQQYRVDDDLKTAISKNVVLEVNVNTKNYDIITNKLKTIPGLKLIGFCEEAQLFLINYNPQIIPKPEKIASDLDEIDPNHKSKINYQVRFEDVIKDCKLFILPVLMEVE
jgi:hypothetical protein